jgi:hypothetical protein
MQIGAVGAKISVPEEAVGAIPRISRYRLRVPTADDFRSQLDDIVRFDRAQYRDLRLLVYCYLKLIFSLGSHAPQPAFTSA